MQSRVLLLDRGGQPIEWISQEDAISYHATGRVIFQIGHPEQFIFRGGINRASGVQSILTTAPIIAVHGESSKSHRVPFIKNRILFARDDHTCAYCGKKFHPKQLTRDHLVPKCAGGRDTWTNLVTACKVHNNLKDNMSLAEFGMPLKFQPYQLSFAEYLYLESPVASLPVQTEYLMDFFPEESRVYERAKMWI